MARVIHAISPVAGTGNRLDLELVCPLLEENGFEVISRPILDRSGSGRLRGLTRRLVGFRRRYDVNLFMGPLFPEWLPFASKNVWIPNVEGFHERHRKFLPFIKLVLAKTRLTEQVFRGLGRPTEFVGFTSRDHFDKQVPRSYKTFFHAASSPFKGTKRLLEIWHTHPEWPELTAVIHQYLPPIDSPNIRAIREYVPDAELRRLQNANGLHLCCSEAEGFGHYIMESLGCGAVTFSTNGPPMNELVQPSRGVLVDCLEETPPLGLSHRYLFRPESFETEVERVRTLDEPALRQLGAAGRAFFLENDRLFRQRFVDVLRAL